MNIPSKIFAAALAIGGILMTTPTFNAADLDLPSAISNVPESSGIVRTGVVTSIEEADNITIKVSGSNVLVRASYLFPQYGPMLGDNVVIIKQDAQWFVWGTPSGPINSLALNPGFEDGALGALPTNWTLTVIANAGGTPTLTKVDSNTMDPLSGLYSADFGTDSVVAGFSQADIFSAAVAASVEEHWTGAYYIVGASIDQNAATGISGGRFSVLEFYIQFLDGASALISESLISTFGTNANVGPFVPVYVRPPAAAQFAEAPAGTAYARIKIRGSFDMSANSFTSFFLDYMILRKV